MRRVRITMDNAALRDVVPGAAAREAGFDVRASQVIRRVGASHEGRPVEEVYEALRASLLQIPGARTFNEPRVRRCATLISERRDPLSRD